MNLLYRINTFAAARISHDNIYLITKANSIAVLARYYANTHVTRGFHSISIFPLRFLSGTRRQRVRDNRTNFKISSPRRHGTAIPTPSRLSHCLNIQFFVPTAPNHGQVFFQASAKVVRESLRSTDRGPLHELPATELPLHFYPEL